MFSSVMDLENVGDEGASASEWGMVFEGEKENFISIPSYICI